MEAIIPADVETKRALWELMKFDIVRYLISNTHGRLDGAEKAERHLRLSETYCRVRLGIGEGYLLTTSTDGIDPFTITMAIHDATQKLTSYLDEEIGFPVFDKHPDYDALAPLFFERFLELADEEVREF